MIRRRVYLIALPVAAGVLLVGLGGVGLAGMRAGRAAAPLRVIQAHQALPSRRGLVPSPTSRTRRSSCASPRRNTSACGSWVERENPIGLLLTSAILTCIVSAW